MALAVRNWFTQAFPPKPKYTEADEASQQGRVFLVTGGNAGVGFELCKILYTTGATVYMASRSQDKAEKAIQEIIALSSDTKTLGTLRFLHLDLNDLHSVKHAADAFAKQESRLDVLWNQAGIGSYSVKPLTKTAQGLDAFIGVNCVAHLLLAELLLPQLRAAAESQPAGAVRVVWCASALAEIATPKGGLEMDRLDGMGDGYRDYSVSKAGNWILGIEFARRRGGDTTAPILSITQNPGNLRTNVYSGVNRVVFAVLDTLMLYDAKFGAYTELYAGLSSELTMEHQGAYVMPWGRIQEKTPRQDIIQAAKLVEEGGLGVGARFWDWCEEQWKGIA